jgi:hypothetical protein
MPSRFEKYRVKDGLTKLGEAFFNPVFRDIDLRLAGMEALRISWEDAVRTVTEYGLIRINEAIGPTLLDAVAKADEIEAKRLAAVGALAALEAIVGSIEADATAGIAAFEASATTDIAAWKDAQLAAIQAWQDSITPSLPDLATGAALTSEISARQSADTALSGRVTTLEDTPGVLNVAYDNRATLRSGAPIDGQQAVVDGLGLFGFAVGSTEPDDDESCFATGTGRWLLQAAHWDLVDAWQAPDDAVRDEDDEDEPLRYASRVLHGTAVCAISSVVSVSSAGFTGTVTGAAVGDRVIANPPAQLGATAADTGRLAYHAWVSAADTVTVMLTNASASTATVNPAVQTAWPVTVLKAI